MAFTVSRALQWWAWDKPTRTAIEFGGEPVSYKDLYDWGLRVADYLRAQGVKPGDRVATAAVNSLEYAVLMVGIMLAGAINTPLSFRASARELRGGLNLVKPALLFTDGERAPIGAEALGSEEAHKLRDILLIRPLRDVAQAGEAHYAQPHEALFIIGTSGSTGAPKGVVYTHGCTMSYAAEFAIMEPATGNGGSILITGPYSSSSGTLCTMQFLSVGATLYTQSKFVPEEALHLLCTRGITTFLASTIFYEKMAALPEFEKADLSAIKFAQIAGARVSTQLIARYQEKGMVLRQAYGSTESGGAWAARDETALSAPEKCGPGAMFTEFAILGEDGNFAPPGVPGEILTRGAALTAGYWDDPEQTAKAYKNGWLHTGDRGVMDARGNLTFIDRIKDIIISGGLNISAIEVEGAISELAGVEEVVVIAAPDKEFGETPLAIIYGDATQFTPEQIVAHCRVALASYKVPRYVAVESEPLPRLPSGKIAKMVLRAKYQDAHLHLERLR